MNEQIVQNKDILFPPFPQDDMVCILCEGSHGNNYMCEMSWEDDGHEIY